MLNKDVPIKNLNKNSKQWLTIYTEFTFKVTVRGSFTLLASFVYL